MKIASILLGKSIQKITTLRGGGSALPGLAIERLDPQFIKKVLSKLPYGVVVISGTNGKTTTTKIVTELLEAQGLRVFTNKTGSNFVRGVISAILADIKITGKFNYDIAVLELDEAHAVKFCEVVPINYALMLNVQRDQLDRFGEIDYTAKLLQKVARCARKAVVLNREDPRICQIHGKNLSYFGLSDDMLCSFPSDDHLIDDKMAKSQLNANVILQSLKGQHAVYAINQQNFNCNLQLKGNYNAFNAAAALALCCQILSDVQPQSFIDALARVQSAFGRGETLTINGVTVEILLVKNPSAFQLSLASFADDQHDYMICINDHIADGRDVSWLWNVDFRQLHNVCVVSGIRATDMALRLKYDDIPVAIVQEDLAVALQKFITTSKKPKRIFTTYTAMLELRKIISGKSLV